MAKHGNKGKSKVPSKETTDEEIKKMLENAEINAMLSEKGEAYWQQPEVMAKEAKRLAAAKAKRQTQKLNKQAKMAEAAKRYQPEENYQRFTPCPNNKEITIFCCKKSECSCLNYKKEAFKNPTHLDFDLEKAKAAKKEAEQKEAEKKSDDLYRKEIQDYDEKHKVEKANLQQNAEDSLKEILKDHATLLDNEDNNDDKMPQNDGPSDAEEEEGDYGEDDEGDEGSEGDDEEENVENDDIPDKEPSKEDKEEKKWDATEPEYSPLQVLSDSDDTKARKERQKSTPKPKVVIVEPTGIPTQEVTQAPNETVEHQESQDGKGDHQKDGAQTPQAKGLKKKKKLLKKKTVTDPLAKLLKNITPEQLKKMLEDLNAQQESKAIEAKNKMINEIKEATKANRKQVQVAIEAAQIDFSVLESYNAQHSNHLELLQKKRSNSQKEVQIKIDAMYINIQKLANLLHDETHPEVQANIAKILEAAQNSLNELINQGQFFLRIDQMSADKVAPPLEDKRDKDNKNKVDKKTYVTVTEKGAKNSKENNSSSKRPGDHKDLDSTYGKRKRPEERSRDRGKGQNEASSSKVIDPESNDEDDQTYIWETPNRRCLHRYACKQGYECLFAHTKREVEWFKEPCYIAYAETSGKPDTEFRTLLNWKRTVYAKQFARQIHKWNPSLGHDDQRSGRGGGQSRGGSNYRSNYGGGSYERSSSSRDH
jgi:hypothetical protein